MPRLDFKTSPSKQLSSGKSLAALLLQENLGTDTLIHPATLHRIGDDIDRERRGREWLKLARQSAKERAKIRGLGGSKGAPTGRLEGAREDVAALGIEPRLVLRPTDPLNKSWEALLEIPDMSSLLLRFPAREISSPARAA